MSRYASMGDLSPQRLFEGVTARALHGERLTLALVELDPDSLLPEHAHDHEQVGIMIVGSFEMRIGGETRELGPGDTWNIPSGEPHEVRVGPEGAVVVEVWAPGRDDWKTIEREPPRELRGFS